MPCARRPSWPRWPSPEPCPIASPPGRDDSSWKRNRDFPAWTAGSVIWVGTGGTCTSGFNVFDPFTNKNYILTAGHCGKVRDFVRDGESYGVLGAVIDEEDASDSAILQYGLAGGNTGDAYGGICTGYGVARAGWERIEVRDVRRSFLGEENICTSGALMGEICGGRIVNKDVWVPLERAPSASLDEVWQIANVAMAGSGDSGGPVFVRTIDRGVSARGVFSATAPDGGRHSCRNPLNFGTRGSCNSTVFITNLQDSMDEHVRNVSSIYGLAIKRG